MVYLGLVVWLGRVMLRAALAVRLSRARRMAAFGQGLRCGGPGQLALEQPLDVPRYFISSGPTSEIASPGSPARAVRPMRCT
jgi:hypothetical protein